MRHWRLSHEHMRSVSPSLLTLSGPVVMAEEMLYDIQMKVIKNNTASNWLPGDANIPSLCGKEAQLTRRVFVGRCVGLWPSEGACRQLMASITLRTMSEDDFKMLRPSHCLTTTTWEALSRNHLTEPSQPLELGKVTTNDCCLEPLNVGGDDYVAVDLGMGPLLLLFGFVLIFLFSLVTFSHKLGYHRSFPSCIPKPPAGCRAV